MIARVFESVRVCVSGLHVRCAFFGFFFSIPLNIKHVKRNVARGMWAVLAVARYSFVPLKQHM